MVLELCLRKVKRFRYIAFQRCFFANRMTLRRWWKLSPFILTIASVFLCIYYITHIHLNSVVKVPLDLSFHCEAPALLRTHKNDLRSLSSNQHASSAQLRLDSSVLVFTETQYSHLGHQIAEILEATRIKFKLEVVGKSLPLLTNMDKGKFSVIIFENFEKYLNMNKWNRELLDEYCREYNVGIIGFMKTQDESYVGAQLKGFPMYIHTNLALRDYHLTQNSTVLRITRARSVLNGNIPGSDWTIFQPNHTTYEALATARSQNFHPFFAAKGINPSLITVIHDHGKLDSIRRILFGNGFQLWLHRLLFLDSLSYLSHGKLSLSLQRYILIDIDDIFVGEKLTRMKPSDVTELLNAQDKIRTSVPGFRFNLGFSGKFYHKGTPEENTGDDLLIKHAHEFWWFGHMWSHSQPHIFDNITALEMEMKFNKIFAQKYNIPYDSGYSVAPHHSGVYPVHELLYEAWKRIWNVRVTSTEEYPHLRPARLRRGFIHRNIMVLPRQTCGLYTHTIFLSKYPGGPEKLRSSIQGGELFYLFVFNPINVFMTHLSNYGNDRLALYTFESVIEFVKCYTNLELMTLPPLQLADKYFQMYPQESDPVWMNPCNDKRHKSIWAPSKSCQQFPKFLVLGPQKTGSTALYTFLSMHPAIVSNYPSPESFEEVQFFNGKNYYRGLEWYMNFFPVPNNSTDKYLFEKSATYFDGELVPMRAHALLPSAKLVVLFISPIKRAYSWYQHMKSHRDPIALNHTFNEIVTSGDKGDRRLRDLRKRCLVPGFYAQHLDRWLSFYPPQQLLIINGDELKLNPVNVLYKLQQFLKIKPLLNYKDRLRYDPKKGFFCQVNQEKNTTKCLGRSKGRQYPSIDDDSEKYLRAFYLPHNVALAKLFTRLGLMIPAWLEKDISEAS